MYRLRTVPSQSFIVRLTLSPPFPLLPFLLQPLTATQLRAAILGGLASSSRSQIAREAASAAASASSAASHGLLTPARERDSLQEVLADYVLVEEQPAAASLAARKIGGAGAGQKRDWLEGLI